MKMRKRLIATFLILSMLFTGAAAYAADTGNFDGTVIDDFEFKDSRGNWWIQNTSNATLMLSNQQAYSGVRSLKYSYNYERGEYAIISTQWSKGGTPVKNSEKYKYIGMWVYGNAKNLEIAIEVQNKEGAMIRYGFTPIDFEGWKYIEYPLAAEIENMRIYNFIVKKPSADFGNTGDIYIDDLTVSKNSYYESGGQNSEIAGMHGISDTTAVKEGAPTLTEADVPAVTRTKPQTAQIGNTNLYQTLIYQTSDKLPESISGAALSDDGTALSITRGTRGVSWAAGWLNDGEELYGKAETCYSSGMHTTPAANEWAMLKFSEPKTIKQINIIPRDNGWCFPSDYTIEISRDGENWDVVAEEKSKKPESKQPMDKLEYPIEPAECSYVRMNATKLTTDGKDYYFQLREIEAIDSSGNNVGLYTNCTEAEGSNPLSTNETLDYDEYFNDIFESGVKWVNIPNVSFWGKQELALGEKENLKYLRENGVNVTYRFTHAIGDISLEEANVVAEEFAHNVEFYVNELKDYVDVWQISNEENFPSKPYSAQKPASYAAIVSKVADRIRELDPGCKIEIETALIDFDWTKNVMEAGLAGKIDIMGVHVYKETAGSDNMIEANGTFIKNGVRMFPKDHPYKDYREEIAEYKKLMEKYNPGSEVWVTETSVNLGSGSYNVTELVQAKWLAREYIYHQMLGVGPTCWWTLHAVKTGETEWGLIDASYRRRDGWYALRNVANTMNNDFKKEESVSVTFSNGENIIFDVFKNDANVYQIPYWVMAKMRSANTGRPTDITVQGITVKNAVAIDMITGTVQELNFETNGDTTVFKDMVARDYPMVIRINSDAKYGEYTGEEAPKTETAQWEKIVKSSILLNTESEFGLVRGSKKELSDIEGVKPIVIDGVSYVPARFLAETLNKHVYWLDGMIVISDSELSIDEETEQSLKKYYEEQEENRV